MTKTLYTYFKTIILFSICIYSELVNSRDLDEIKNDGVLRHIGVPYANFITLYKENNRVIVGGLDVELMQGFAKHLNVKYQFVEANWGNVFSLLTGQQSSDHKNEPSSNSKILGDVAANGLTILPWRKELVDFSKNYFPSAVWLMARADSSLKPIIPSGSVTQDINTVKELLTNHDVLAMNDTCLDPNLYNMYDTQANIILPQTELKLREMIPAILNNDAESTLLDVPDILIALEKWSGEIKVIGPISENQDMAVAFRKNSPALRHAFNQYLMALKNNGEFNRLVEKYYPSVFDFYPDYFIIDAQ